MIQVLSKATFHVGYGGANSTGAITGQGGVIFVGGWAPCAFAGMFQNLVVYAGVPFVGSVTVTVTKNRVDTAMSTVVTPGATIAVDLTNTVTVVPGDIIEWKMSGTIAVPFPGNPLAISMEFSGLGMIFGVGAVSGSFGVGVARYGGALGNGVFSGYGGNPLIRSNTYSICAVDGDVTTLCLRRGPVAAPVGGFTTAYLIKNLVIQDGSGGTVDTSCVLLDGTVFSSASFVLPVTLTDIVECLMIRSGTFAPFQVEQVGAGIGLVPTTDGHFMFCGGNNDAIPIIQTWKWNASEQGGATVEHHQSPVGPRGFTVNGLLVERGNPAGVGQSYTQTILDSNVLTPTVVTISGGVQVIGTSVVPHAFAPDGLITLQVESTAGASSNSQLHWGIGVESTPEPPPTCPGRIIEPRTDGLPYVPFSP